MKNRSGFTMVEILIYSAILAIFLGAVFSFIASILGTTDNLLERNELLANTEFVESKIGWLTSLATGVTTPAPNSSGTALKMNLSDLTLDPALFSLTSSTINLSFASGTPAALTNDRVRVTTFEVKHLAASSSPPQLKISLALQSAIYPNIVATTTLFYVLPK